MAEALIYDTFSGTSVIGEEEKFKEHIKNLNEKLCKRTELSMNDIYEEINKDLPDGMKLGRYPLCNDVYLGFDYIELKHNSDYKPITLECTKIKELPLMTLKFDMSKIKYEDKYEDL